jgi:probable rRNA maturation factor
MIEIQVDEAFKQFVVIDTINTAIIRSFSHQKIELPIAMSMVITSKEEIQTLNFTYRDVNKPTDILSFSSSELDPESQTRYWGDIVIAYLVAEEQAQQAGYPVLEELQLLTVHGCLHLLGFTHYDDEEKEVMWKAQDEILTSLGVSARPDDN